MHRPPPNSALRVAAGLVGGAFLAGAMVPWGWWPLAPAAVTCLVLAVRGASLLAGAGVAFLAGVSSTLLMVPWLRAVGDAAWWAMSGVLGLHFAVWGLGAVWLTRRPWWPVTSAGLWLVAEWLRSSWPWGGFPWGRLAWTVVDSPLQAWLPWLGIGGTGLLLALAGTTLAWAVTGRRVVSRRVRIATLPALAAGAAGLFGLPLAFPPASTTIPWVQGAPTLRVAAVQGGVPGAGNDLVAHHEEVTRRLADATARLAAKTEDRGLDLVVWPENSTAVDPDANSGVRALVSRASAALSAPLLVGTIEDGPRPGTARNQSRLWRAGEDEGAVYTKRHLVPFGEYVPLRDVVSKLGIGRLDEVPRDMLPGDEQAPFSVAGARLGAMICFDVAYADTARHLVREGAELLVVQTSNATFSGTTQLDQQLVITRARALATGRAVVVAATTGISAVIGPDGSLWRRSTTDGASALVADVPLISRPTPALTVGSWPIWFSGAVVAVGALARAGGRARRHRRCR